MNATRLFAITLVASATLVAAAKAADGSGTEHCRQQIGAIDDQADLDLRDLNRSILLLERELADAHLAADPTDDRADLRQQLDAAKRRRAEVFDKQHEDLNVIRARCKQLRSPAPVKDALETIE